MKVIISADHRGAAVALRLHEKLIADGFEASVVNSDLARSVDYPDRAHAVGTAVGSGEVDRGILICGTGIGMSIAANKIDGVRAAVVGDELTAQLSRSHNNANVLCLSADLLGMHLIEKIVDTWMATPFEGGRHARRVEKIHAIERGENPANMDDTPEVQTGVQAGMQSGASGKAAASS